MKSSRRGGIPPFYAMEVLKAANERAAAGVETLHLEVGEPGAGTPLAVREAGRAALSDANLGYTEAFGLPNLRNRIADHYRTAYGVPVRRDQVAITAGSSAGFVLSFLAAFDVGDKVAMAIPGYPGYRNILLSLGLEPVGLRTDERSRFQPTTAMLEEAGDIAGLILASPANPTGTMIEEPVFRELCDYCERRAIRLVSDEIYHGVTYGRPAATALRHSSTAVVLNGFSKYYCMTGWRLGWMIVPDDLIGAVQRLQQNLYISAPTPAQHAAGTAFDCVAELDGNVAAYARNRDLLVTALAHVGVTRLAPPDGAFYLYADVSHLTNDSVEFCRRLLEETGVAITPGIDFDAEQGRASVRLSYAGPEAVIAEAAARLTAWLRR
jgi:aspartate/methionine/tyrosine aminotransferase